MKREEMAMEKVFEAINGVFSFIEFQLLPIFCGSFAHEF